jgi:hypothetical protein
MKETTLEQIARDPLAFAEATQHDRLLITHGGRPLAVVIGIENKDEEDLRLEADPDLWEMIELRRLRPTVPLRDAEATLFADQPPDPLIQ